MKKKKNGLDDILLSQSNEKKVEFMHSIGMTHDNAQEILNMGDILMQSGYSKEAYDLLTVPPAWETLRHQLEKERA